MTTEAGKVVAVIGEVTAESSGGSRQLSVDSPVFADDVLVTGQDERIEVLFRDGTRLSQGENSRLNIDSYVYDPADAEGSEILLNAVQGTFRTITGKISEENPDNFSLQTPLATLGIRGTTVLSFVTPEHEMHGPQLIEEGKTFVVTDTFGNLRFITDHNPVKVIDLWPGEPAGFQRILTEEELFFFDQEVPLTPEITDLTGDTGVEGADAADAAVPFGSGEIETIADQNRADVPVLFGPVGLEISAAGKPSDLSSAVDPFAQENTGIREISQEPRDMLGGEIEDASESIMPPAARSGSAVLDEDTTFTGQLNAANTGNGPLTFTVVTDPQHGSLSLSPDGSYVYQPSPNYFGDDGFTYQVTDDFDQTSSAGVSLQINPVNDPPVARDATYRTSSPVTGQLLATDVDGDPLHFSLADAPGHGSVTINSNGKFTYIPSTGFSGTDYFQFRVSDGQGGHDTGRATILVGSGPAPPPPPGPPPPPPTGVVWFGDNDGAGPAVSDTYTGTPYDDELYGLDLVDTLNGGDGNDLIEGGDGDDILGGDGGDDQITGGLGSDVLTGGSGSDTFIYVDGSDSAEGDDTIVDFATGTDKIQIGTVAGLPIITVSGSSYFGMTSTGTITSGSAIIIFHNTVTTTGRWEVLYDPDIGTTGSPDFPLADLGTDPIDAGDIVFS